MTPYPPLRLADRVLSLDGDGDPFAAYEVLGADTRRSCSPCCRTTGRSRAARVLDFGCGAGRTLRHFLAEADSAEIWGVDIDAESVAWLQAYAVPAADAATLRARAAARLRSREVRPGVGDLRVHAPHRRVAALAARAAPSPPARRPADRDYMGRWTSEASPASRGTRTDRHERLAPHQGWEPAPDGADVRLVGPGALGPRVRDRRARPRGAWAELGAAAPARRGADRRGRRASLGRPPRNAALRHNIQQVQREAEGRARASTSSRSAGGSRGRCAQLAHASLATGGEADHAAAGLALDPAGADQRRGQRVAQRAREVRCPLSGVETLEREALAAAVDAAGSTPSAANVSSARGPSSTVPSAVAQRPAVEQGAVERHADAAGEVVVARAGGDVAGIRRGRGDTTRDAVEQGSSASSPGSASA